MSQIKPTILEKFELEIMHVVWDKGKATVHEVKDALSEIHPAAYTTFLTTMRRMEEKGIVEHELHEDGRSYVYKPLVSREEVTKSMFQDVYERLFLGSSERLFNTLNALLGKEKMFLEIEENIPNLILILRV